MKIIVGNPPNIQTIKQYLNPPEWAVFPYGEVIYNPSGRRMDEDIVYHEQVHTEQQKLFTSPEFWWMKYLLEREYRLECEVEAYGKQYQWWKERAPNKDVKEALEEMALALSSWYNLGITKAQAETLIRKLKN